MARARKFITSPLKVIACILVVGVFLVAGALLAHTTHLFSSAPKTNFPKTLTKGGGSVSLQKGQTKSNTPTSTSNESAATTSSPVDKSLGQNTSNAYLISPWGNFVSNHQPGQNSTPQTETSVCNTTQGATCYISFTNGSIVKTLPAQLADSNGATFWENWSPASIGLTQGDWKITATATLDGQSKSTTDPMELVVS